MQAFNSLFIWIVEAWKKKSHKPEEWLFLHSWKTIQGGTTASRGGNTKLSLDVPNPAIVVSDDMRPVGILWPIWGT